MSATPPVSVALLGSGRMGSIRGRLIQTTPGLRVTYVVDTDPIVGQKLAQELGATFTTDEAEALKHVQAVWISTPTDYHADQIKRAAQAGKIVATEKPVAFTRQEIAQVYDVVEKNHSSLTVGFNRRSDPHFLKFKQSLDLHKPAHIIRIVNRDHPIPAAAQFAHLGSIWADFLIHDFDTAVWLVCGSDRSLWPTTLYAVGSQLMTELKGTTVLDTALVHITFPNGTLVSIEASRYSPGGYDQRLEAITRTATIFADNPLKTQVRVVTAAHGETDLFEWSFPQRYGAAYRAEVERFSSVLAKTEKPVVTREECLLVARLVEAAERSYQTKQPVTLSYDD